MRDSSLEVTKKSEGSALILRQRDVATADGRRARRRRVPGSTRAARHTFFIAFDWSIAMPERTIETTAPELRGGLRALRALLVAALVSLCASPSLALADDDLPARVARVADFAGQLFVSPEERAGEWSEIGLNYPLTSGDNVFVSADGRAEIDYGGGQLRFAGDTNVHVSRLDDRQLAFFVAQGRVIVRARVLEAGESITVDTPNTQLQLTRPGLYRVDVLPDQQVSVVTVRDGEALAALANGALPVLPGQSATIAGTDPAFADVRLGAGDDGFDTWSADRDRYYEQGRSIAYVSPAMVGYAPLDQYGTWQQYPDYGPVWFPNDVAPGWAPYSDGYWVSVGGWGYTWVDYAPWGYAPFHYGRWAYVGGRWGWCPGRLVARPVWAPALVAWHGGARWMVSAGAGAPVYGWVPLGWREPYIPWWRACSSRCWSHLNHPYGVAARERPRVPPTQYVNSAVPGAFTAVSATALARSQPVAPNRVRLPQGAATSAPALANAPALPRPRPQPPAIATGGAAPVPASSLAPPRARAGTAASTGVGSPSSASPLPSRPSAAPGTAVPLGTGSTTGSMPRSFPPQRPVTAAPSPSAHAPAATTIAIPPARAAPPSRAPVAPTGTQAVPPAAVRQPQASPQAGRPPAGPRGAAQPGAAAQQAVVPQQAVPQGVQPGAPQGVQPGTPPNVHPGGRPTAPARESAPAAQPQAPGAAPGTVNR
jgi:hypothetical protein